MSHRWTERTSMRTAMCWLKVTRCRYVRAGHVRQRRAISRTGSRSEALLGGVPAAGSRAADGCIRAAAAG